MLTKGYTMRRLFVAIALVLCVVLFASRSLPAVTEAQAPRTWEYGNLVVISVGQFNAIVFNQSDEDERAEANEAFTENAKMVNTVEGRTVLDPRAVMLSMDYLGALSWELVTVTLTENVQTYYFKRETAP